MSFSGTKYNLPAGWLVHFSLTFPLSGELVYSESADLAGLIEPLYSGLTLHFASIFNFFLGASSHGWNYWFQNQADSEGHS